jgi:hypothetical protein
MKFTLGDKSTVVQYLFTYLYVQSTEFSAKRSTVAQNRASLKIKENRSGTIEDDCSYCSSVVY